MLLSRNIEVFQSTLSVRRATWANVDDMIADYISIHALRKESDKGQTYANAEQAISIHALRKESDCSMMASAR